MRGQDQSLDEALGFGVDAFDFGAQLSRLLI